MTGRAEQALAELRDRLQQQSTLPPLPAGWHSHSAMIPAEGYEYGGDFYVADLDGDILQMVLVDVCGHGDAAVPAAVQFAGALRGLVHALAAEDVMDAANRYLLGLPEEEESFTTVVQVIVDLGTGRYRIRSAGHPPVLVWDPEAREWRIDNARGTALGVTAEPQFDLSTGVLAPGAAFLFYTDGVVESRGAAIDVGIEWLRRTAGIAVAEGFPGAAGRILREVTSGEDDRAILVLGRDAR